MPLVRYYMLMAQYHKIPQNVTTYQGRIIGKFTAKQFIFLAVGGIIAFLVFNTELPGNIKIPTSIVSIGSSLIFAVLNYEGRSADMWIQSFINAVYATTQMRWKKRIKPIAFTMPGYHPHRQASGPRKRTTSELNRYLDLRGRANPKSDLSKEEQTIVDRIRKINTDQKKQSIANNTSTNGT